MNFAQTGHGFVAARSCQRLLGYGGRLYARASPAVLRLACFSLPLWQICTMLRHLRSSHQPTTGPIRPPKSIQRLRSGDCADPEQTTAFGAVASFGSAALTTAGAGAEMVALFDSAAEALVGADVEELTVVDAGALGCADVGPHVDDRSELLPSVTSFVECTCCLSCRCPICQ